MLIGKSFFNLAAGVSKTIRVSLNGKGKKVKCVVKQVKSIKRHHKGYRLRWRLMQGGHVVGHGTSAVHHGRLRLNARRLRKGSYALRVQGQKGGTRIQLR